MNYIVKAFDKMNCEIIAIKRNTETKAIKTANYWCERGATYCIVEDEDYNRIAWIDKNNIVK